MDTEFFVLNVWDLKTVTGLSHLPQQYGADAKK